MRRSCALALLLVLAAAPASADIGLVADLDGNYQNGPDTLQIEPGDTVLVHVWITGAGDSLVGFGITIGDSSGALVWAAEPAESTYTIPGGWMQVEGALDQEGRVLLQGQDFSFSEPLVLPRQVAELKFTVAPGESCGTIGWDPEMSGWQDWGFDEGVFGISNIPLVCVSEMIPDYPWGGNPPTGPPTDDSGRTVVTLEAWPTFPVLRTDCMHQEEVPWAGEYWVHFRQLPVAPVLARVLSPDAGVLASAGPTTRDGRVFRRCWTKGGCGPRKTLVMHYDGRLKTLPSYVEQVWDPRTETVVTSAIEDSSYIAVFEFAAGLTPGNSVTLQFGETEVYREVIPTDPGGFSRTVTPMIIQPTPEESFQLFVNRHIEARRRRGATEQELEQYRVELEQYHEAYR